jgi:hypothetical protein
VWTEEAGYGAGGLELREADEGGVVTFVLLLTTLAGSVDVTGENGKGESDKEGEWDKGVLLPEGLLFGRWICDEGRGMGTPPIAGTKTPFTGREAVGNTRTEVEVEGDKDALDHDLRCVGCEYGSNDDIPIKLSTDNPSRLL